MKQLTFFNDCTDPIKPLEKDSQSWKLFIDGASRNNPGRSGAGVYLLKNEEPVYKEGFYLGIKTNNQAEYLALLLGIFSVKNLLNPEDILYVVSDSELLVRQIKGEYKVKKPELKLLYTCVFSMLKDINYSFCHVLRHLNKEADALANKGIDDGTPVPQDFSLLLANHGFKL
ncbi:MAG: ribonuclease HI family protein [Candidatus Babeliales bacterium]